MGLFGGGKSSSLAFDFTTVNSTTNTTNTSQALGGSTYGSLTGGSVANLLNQGNGSINNVSKSNYSPTIVNLGDTALSASPAISSAVNPLSGVLTPDVVKLVVYAVIGYVILRFLK